MGVVTYHQRQVQMYVKYEDLQATTKAESQLTAVDTPEAGARYRVVITS